MTQVFVLLVLMSDGFAIMPFDSQDACRAAMAGLPPAIVAEAECVQIEMLTPSSVYAPEQSPLPVPKPGQDA